MNKLVMAKNTGKKYLPLFLFSFLLFFSFLWLVSLSIQKVQAQAASCQAPPSSSGSTNLQPQVGGVALDQAATFLANMDDLTGAYYDATLDRIVFVGKKNTTLPEFDKDDLAIAIKSIIFEGTLPAVSLELDPVDPNGPNLKAYYYGPIENTRFGKVMIDADYKLKNYVNGYDQSQQVVTSSVPGYKSVMNRYIENPNADPLSYPSSTLERFWLSPLIMNLKKDDTANAFVFDQAKMRVRAESLGQGDPVYHQVATEFADHFTNNYDLYAQESPIYQELKQLGKIVSVVKWMGDLGIATDFNWARDYAPKIVSTPKTLPKITTPVVPAPWGTNQAIGGADYYTPNTYNNASGIATALKTASEAVNAPKETIHWTFSKDGQQYESVAVAADAFRSLGSYNTSVTDMSFPAIGDFDLSFSRTYSSYSGGQNGIGRGWSFLPAQLVDDMPLVGGNVVQTFCPSPPQNFFKRAGLAFIYNGSRETFRYNNINGICSYLPQESFYHAQITVTKPNVTTRQYEVTRQDQTKYVFEEYFQSNGILPQPQSLYSFRLIHIKDHNGNKINYIYDTQNRLISIKDDKNHVLTLSYNAQNLVSQIADWTNRTVKYGYDAQGNLVTVTDPRNNTTTYAYDTNNKLVKITDREGSPAFINTYTPEAKIASRMDPNSTTKTFTYSNSNRTVQISDATRTSLVKYDQRARILEDTDALNNKIVYTYGSEYAPLSIKDKNNNLTSYAYDARGNITSTTYPDGKKVTFTYNPQNRVTKISDERYSPTKVTDLFYYVEGNSFNEPKDNLWYIREADKITYFRYHPDGQLYGIWDPLDNLTRWEYDDFGNKKFHIYPNGKWDQFFSNSLGLIYWHYDPTGKATSFAYNSNNYLAGKWTDPNTPQQQETRYQYDKENRLKETILPNNAVTSFSYVAPGLLASVKDPANATTTYGYDAYKNLGIKKDALQRTTTYSYDKLNNRTQATTPLGNTIKWEYDANGNLTKRIDEENKSTTYQYNNLNRLIKKTFPDNTTVNRSYDNRNNLTQLVDTSGTTTYTYDVFDRLTKAENAFGAVQYQYDLADKLTKVIYPDGKAVAYAYNVNSRVTSVTDWNNSATNYEYYDNNFVKKKTLPNGIETAYVYDNANRVTEITHKKGAAILAKYTYERNKIGGITKVTEVDNFSPNQTPPSGTYTFLKGINFNGNAATIEGNSWQSMSTALSNGLSIPSGYTSANTSLTPNPAVDNDTNGMLNTAIWRSNAPITINQTVENGEYQVYLWVMENYQSNVRKMNVKLENTQVATDVGYLAKNSWMKYGPYTVTVADGTLNTELVNTQDSPHIKGMAIYKKSAGGVTPTPTPTQGPSTNYTGEYFNNISLSGTPILTRTDATINFDWGGSGSPDPLISVDNFSARWTRTDTFTQGPYEFTATADDGLRLYVDGVKILDKWIDQGPTTYKVTKDLSTGSHTIVYEYYEKGGGALAKLSFQEVAGTTNTWTPCANENQTCSFSGTRQVRYGASNTYAYKTATSSIVCNNATFGDPIPLTAKQCSYADTTETPTPTPTPGSGSYIFSKGINLNGNGVTIEGNPWQSMSTALSNGFSVPSGYISANTSLTPSPTVDSDSNNMLNSAIWRQNAPLNMNQTVSNGDYQVYLWVMENFQSNVRKMNVKLENTQVATDVGYLSKNSWVKYGPYTATVTDGTLNVDLVNVVDSPHVMGIAIYKKSGTAFIFNWGSMMASISEKFSDVFTPRKVFAQTAGQQTIITYVYDAVGRLANAVYPATNYTYTYDSVGNRLTNTKNGTLSTATYNADNQLTTVDTTPYTYDKKGNQIQSGQKTYSYNAENKLTAYTDASVQTQYTYDGLHNRLSQKVGNTTTQFVNDISGDLTNVLVAKNTTTNTSSFFVQGPEVISEGGSAVDNRKYYLTDGLGNIRFVTDSNGNHLQSISYDPYGNPLQVDSTAAYKFKSEQADQGGMVFMRARYYDPATGRFISKDPIDGTFMDPRTQNGYDFAGSDPINGSDPSGLYYNAGFSAATLGLGMSCGVLINDDGTMYPYVGAGISTPGPGVSMTYSPGEASPGFSMDASVSGPVSIYPNTVVTSRDVDTNERNVEGGYSSPGASYMFTQTFDPL